MVKEIDEQSQICKALNDQPPNFAMKMSHRFAVGIPDLLIKTPIYPMMVVEIKLVIAFQNINDTPIIFKHELTVLQKRTLRLIARAGGISGYIAILRLPGGDRLYYTQKNPDYVPTKSEFMEASLCRKRGNPLLPIINICLSILNKDRPD